MRFWISRFYPLINELSSAKAAAMIVFGGGMLATCGLMTLERKITFNQEEKLAVESLSSVRAALEESLYKRFTLVVSLEALVQSHLDLNQIDSLDKDLFQKQFARFTNSLDNQVPGVLSLQLAPDGVVSYLTNVERNRSALGHDILKDPNRREQVLRTIREKGVIISGPVTLRQGGFGLIARKPVFIGHDIYSPQRYIDQQRFSASTEWLQDIPPSFWGFATVLIEPQILYQEAGFDDYQHRYQFAIQGRHGLGRAGDVFWGQPSVFKQPLTSTTVPLPNGEWIIAVKRVSGVSWLPAYLIGLFGLLISLVVTYSVYARLESEVRLQESNQLLLRATRLKDEFLANMSHELRTPLNSILGMAEAIQASIFGRVTSEQVRALDAIERSGYHLLALINDILDLAKIESGQVELDFQPADLKILCLASLDFIRQQAMKKKLKIEFIFPDRPETVVVDERRIRQVLINLLNNAVKFTPIGGEIILEVRSGLIAVDKDDSIQIIVRDTGVGIAREHIDKLFRPFIQIDSALNRQYQGTGLGLALVAKIISLHRGNVTLNSELGKGTCFTITLPRHPENHHVDTFQDEINEIETKEIRSQGHQLILVVEDNIDNVEMLSKFLEAQSFKTIVAQNGIEAVAKARKHLPDMILMDIQLPRLDGLDAIKQLRQFPETAQIPIIALTALAMEGDRERCLEVGADEYLSKPVRLKVLLQKILSLLSEEEI